MKCVDEQHKEGREQEGWYIARKVRREKRASNVINIRNNPQSLVSCGSLSLPTR